MIGYNLELVVLRDVARLAEQSGGLYKWASSVVVTACSERRNVRVRAIPPMPVPNIQCYCPANTRWHDGAAGLECWPKACPRLGAS